MCYTCRVCCASIVYRSLVLSEGFFTIGQGSGTLSTRISSLLSRKYCTSESLHYSIPFHSFSERDFNMKKNQATLFLGVIDGQNYLLDVNDSGSYHAKGGQYIVIVAEDSIKVEIVEPNVRSIVAEVQCL